MNINFGREIISKNIKAHGKTFTFKRDHKNDFGEPDGIQATVTSVQGLFHQTRGFVTKNTDDGTVSRTKPQSQILCLSDEKVNLIHQGDKLEYLGAEYTVTAVNDVNGLGIACDISLEVFDNGV